MSVSVYGVGLVWPYLSELLHLVHLTPAALRVYRSLTHIHTHIWTSLSIINSSYTGDGQYLGFDEACDTLNRPRGYRL